MNCRSACTISLAKPKVKSVSNDADKLTGEIVDRVLDKFQFAANKADFFSSLNKTYGVKKEDILRNFKSFHEALVAVYGKYHFAVERQMVRELRDWTLPKSGEVRVEGMKAFVIMERVIIQELAAKTHSYVKNTHDKSQWQSKERLEAIGETAAMVGHDIRNPLQAIESDLYLLRSDIAELSNEETQRVASVSLESLEKNVRYIGKIVRDLQDFAKRLEPVFQRTDFVALCNDVVSAEAVSSGCVVSCVAEKNAKKVFTDPVYLKRVLSNLVTNAAQAMPDGGRIEVHASLQNGNYVVSVTDGGVGIAEDVKARVFEPLFTTKAKGQGMGLAVAKRLTEALGGTLSFESEAGRGAVFTVQLPQTR